MTPLLRAASCLLLLLATTAAAAQAPVVIYRCVGADGHVSLGDAPCASGTREEVRSMQRPVDGVPRPVPVPAAVEARERAHTRTIIMRTPQPMYDCVTPEGERYTSDNGDGNPRWVPLWTLGYGPWRGRDPRAGTDRPPPPGGPVGGRPPRPEPGTGGGHRPPPLHRIGAGGTWIRDTCHPLPQREVCSRLLERRDEIRKRFFNAQERERDTLRREERGINARLDSDCGAGG